MALIGTVVMLNDKLCETLHFGDLYILMQIEDHSAKWNLLAKVHHELSVLAMLMENEIASMVFGK